MTQTFSDLWNGNIAPVERGIPAADAGAGLSGRLYPGQQTNHRGTDIKKTGSETAGLQAVEKPLFCVKQNRGSMHIGEK